MPTNVNRAFEEFLKNKVNLDPEDTSTARSDRETLRTRVRALQTSVDYFPTLYTEADIDFGSFARRTKIRPLDDIDMFFCMNAEGATYEDSGSEELVITVNDASSHLYQYTSDDNKTLNSIKVLNKFKRSLESIYQYRNSEVNRRQEVVVLTLNNKDWSFDIVPCFKTAEQLGKTYYLIPDGKGHWKKADPRIDQKRTTDINQRHDGYVLNIIRIMKYWSARPTMPSIGSYLLENMILNYYEGKYLSKCSSYIDIELPSVFLCIRDSIYSYVADPKGLQGNLNTLSQEEKEKIWNRANEDYYKAVEARRLETNSPSSTHKECINKWREIFGSEFPTYG